MSCSVLDCTKYTLTKYQHQPISQLMEVTYMKMMRQLVLDGNLMFALLLYFKYNLVLLQKNKMA